MRQSLWLLVFSALLGVSGTANAIPFRIIGSDVNVTFENGGALGGYDANSMGAAIDLGEGDSFVFNFGTVWAPLSLGSGTGTLTVYFESPTPDGGVVNGASFSIGSLLVGIVSVDWTGPLQFAYSYGEAAGGLFQLEMFNIEKQPFLGGFDLTGKITNLVSPTVSVPEPAALALLGTGLLLVGVSRVRRRR